MKQLATCVEALTCFPTTLEGFFEIYQIQTGVPTSIILGLLVGIIVLAIYVHTRSLAHLVVMGTYSIAAFSAMFLNDTLFEGTINTALYAIAFAIASVIVIMVLKVIKE